MNQSINTVGTNHPHERMIINVVTGNEHKIRELQNVFPESLQLQMTTIELDEIQTLDTAALVRHKLAQAYGLVQAPIIVEDVSAELAHLNGLPGPFIKFFAQRLGVAALYKLSYEGAAATIRCTMGYRDGSVELIVEGVVEGTITAPRSGNGFGFDYVFRPNGYDQTFSELGETVKNTISHRYLAASALVDKLTAAKIL